MKKIILFILLIFLSFICLSQDKNDVHISMTLVGENIVNIRIKKPTNKKFILSVYNDVGVKVYRKKFKEGKKVDMLFTHDIKIFDNGIYEYKILEDKEEIFSKKVMKIIGHDLKYVTSTNKK